MTERIVIRAPNWLGDMVMALPAVRQIREARPQATIAVAAPAATAVLFRFAPGVDEVVPLSNAKGARGLARLDSDSDALARGRFNLALLLTNSFSSAWAMRRAAVPERWGYRTDVRGWLLTRAVRRRAAKRRSPHHADYYLALVDALGLAADGEPGRPLLVASDEARARARELLADRGWDGASPLVGVAPGAAFGRAKQYPPELMASVVDALAADGVTSVLVGAGEDAPIGRALEAALGRGSRLRTVNLIGVTDLATFVGLLGQLAAMVANDSGAMHVAAALGTPVTAIFGSTDEHATSPLGPHTVVSADVWCRPCLLRECPIDHRCMRRIAPHRIVDSVRAQMATRPNVQRPDVH